MQNKALYDALVKVFKHVTVENQDQKADIQILTDGSGSWIIPASADHGEQYRVNCPFCHDHKQHQYISYLSYVRPVVAGTPQAEGKQRAQCFRNSCLKTPKNFSEQEKKICMALTLVNTSDDASGSVYCETDTETNEQKLDVSSEVSLDGLRTWIPDWMQIDSHTDSAVIDYLARRRVSMEDVEWLNIGWGPIRSARTNEYINDGHPWILFPIINNGKLAGVQARCPDVYLKEGGIKYYFHPGCRKKTVLLNLDVARTFGIGVICEGAFDVLSIGKPGVCTFGHTPSVQQKRILSGFDRGQIWLPDTDIRPDLNGIEIARKQAAIWNEDNRFELGVHVVVLPEKDAGDMKREDIWIEILKQVDDPMRDYLCEHVINKL